MERKNSYTFLDKLLGLEVMTSFISVAVHPVCEKVWSGVIEIPFLVGRGIGFFVFR